MAAIPRIASALQAGAVDHGAGALIGIRVLPLLDGGTLNKQILALRRRGKWKWIIEGEA
jgi:hypothetical protein